MSERAWTLVELLRWTSGYFAEHGVASPRLDADLLLAHVLDMPRLDLYLSFDQTVSAEDRARYRELIRRRAVERVPVAYLTGRREFWSLPLRVSPAVLIPRPETEVLVRATVELKPDRIAEVGVGSGCVSAAVAREIPGARLVATDCSAEALAVAAENLAALDVAERVELVQAHGLPPDRGPFDAILSNPPYIPSAQLDALAPELAHEPRVALDGGPDGLDVLRQLASAAPDQLARPGWLLLEVGAGQAAEVEALLRAGGAERVDVHPDLAGVPRVVAARYGEA